MTDFTKEELQFFLMVMKPFHWLWQDDPLKLEEKIQIIIDNYCEHLPEGVSFSTYPLGSDMKYQCKKCGEFYR